MKKNLEAVSRRRFLRATGGVALAWSVVPRHVVAGGQGTAPSERLNLAAIGVGGMGAGDLEALAPGNNVVGLCDVDEARAGGTHQRYPKAKRYRDFRRMFDELGSGIDAVLVATPDHTHAVAAMAAIQRGKHVYCEKPLAHSVGEVRALMRAAREQKVVTQLGNQGHSFDSIRDFCEWIWDGAIGKVHTVHAGCAAVNSGIDQLDRLSERPVVPSTLDWDLWLGPAAWRPYHPVYLPGNWRGWVPFGNGTVGDWTCHVVDPVFWALDLGLPAVIEAEVKGYDFARQGDAYPKGEKIRYEFPARGDRGPVTMYWYSGTERIPRPPELEEGEPMVETGAVVMGEKGTIMYGSHGASGVRLIPASKRADYRRPEKTLPRGKEHHRDWLEAIRSGTKAGSDFAYGGPLTEVALLGVIAIKFAGQKLEWDAEAMRFPNCPEADGQVDPGYRSGWHW